MVRVSQGPRPEDKFTLISNQFMRDTTLPPRAKAVYLYMRSHADGWELNTTVIADALGMARNTAQAAVNDLIEAGYLDRRQKRGADGRMVTVEYTIFAEAVDRGSEIEQRGEVLKNCAPGAQKLSDKCSKIEPYKKTKKTNKEDYHARDDVDGFDEWWEACPKKVGKGAARTAYAKAVKKSDPATLLSGIRAASMIWSRDKTEKRYIPNPATWLNQERWEDETLKGVSASSGDLFADAVADPSSIGDLLRATGLSGPSIRWDDRPRDVAVREDNLAWLRENESMIRAHLR